MGNICNSGDICKAADFDQSLPPEQLGMYKRYLETEDQISEDDDLVVLKQSSSEVNLETFCSSKGLQSPSSEYYRDIGNKCNPWIEETLDDSPEMTPLVIEGCSPAFGCLETKIRQLQEEVETAQLTIADVQKTNQDLKR